MSIPKHYSPVTSYIVLPNDADGFIKFITNVFDAEQMLRVDHETGDMMVVERSGEYRGLNERAGQCVRLFKSLIQALTSYSSDPLRSIPRGE